MIKQPWKFSKKSGDSALFVSADYINGGYWNELLWGLQLPDLDPASAVLWRMWQQ